MDDDNIKTNLRMLTGGKKKINSITSAVEKFLESSTELKYIHLLGLTKDGSIIEWHGGEASHSEMICLIEIIKTILTTQFY